MVNFADILFTQPEPSFTYLFFPQLEVRLIDLFYLQKELICADIFLTLPVISFTHLFFN